MSPWTNNRQNCIKSPMSNCPKISKIRMKVVLLEDRANKQTKLLWFSTTVFLSSVLACLIACLPACSLTYSLTQTHTLSLSHTLSLTYLVPKLLNSVQTLFFLEKQTYKEKHTENVHFMVPMTGGWKSVIVPFSPTFWCHLTSAAIILSWSSCSDEAPLRCMGQEMQLQHQPDWPTVEPYYFRAGFWNKLGNFPGQYRFS